ncbi:MAG: PhnD/SsuA/transferrin family substrate-binding protein [Acidobacteriota bacterium]
MSGRRIRAAVLAGLASVGLASGAAGQRTLMVYLPSAPVEAANRQASAVTSLAEVLSQQLPEETLEAEIFRRWRDAKEYLSTHSDVSLMLSDAAFALQAPEGLEPAYRFVRQGRETYRRRLVVRRDRSDLGQLADLKQKSLAIVEAAGAGDAAFLQREIFSGDLDPATWFATLQPTTDDFEATASVLYGQTDAALIAEYNPLLADHLEMDLRVIYDSPEISLPVLSVRSSAFDEGQRRALDRAVRQLAADPAGQKTLARLGIEGLRPVGGGAALELAQKDAKRLEIALPTGSEWSLGRLPRPGASELSFGVAVELPEIPLTPDPN